MNRHESEFFAEIAVHLSYIACEEHGPSNPLPQYYETNDPVKIALELIQEHTPEHGFTYDFLDFGEEQMEEPIDGFVVAESGKTLIGVSRDLTPPQSLGFILHAWGHVATHLFNEKYAGDIWRESRRKDELDPLKMGREYAADSWSRIYVGRILLPLVGQEQPFAEGIKLGMQSRPRIKRVSL